MSDANEIMCRISECLEALHTARGPESRFYAAAELEELIADLEEWFRLDGEPPAWEAYDRLTVDFVRNQLGGL